MSGTFVERVLWTLAYLFALCGRRSRVNSMRYDYVAEHCSADADAFIALRRRYFATRHPTKDDDT